jgi:hypothetical protein
MGAFTARELADLAGFLASLTGAIGSILLAFPLFHLLHAREAIEDIERNLDALDRADDRFDELHTALRDLKVHVRQRRHRAVRIGIVGVVFLSAAAALISGQAMLLYF